MKTTDSLIPYILMTLHPIMHLSLLVSSLILVHTNQEQFYYVETCKPQSAEAKDFLGGYKYNLMSFSFAMHGSALTLHWLSEIFYNKGIKILASFLIIAKMLVYLILILKIQSSIDFIDCALETNKSQVMVWLTFEVVIFYLNLTS